MSDIAVRVDRLGKQYRIGKRERYRTLRDTLTDAAAAPFRKVRSLFVDSNKEKEQTPSDLIWALKDVSFEVPRGSVVGVIGRNGAGKSTLLKVLSRITEPTEGRVEIHGRVGSLLEVGTGFHPELTGRENIFLNGAILGMKRAEIERKFDEIVAFAEIDKFIDTPVKHYSSGMYMRLAFAVAAHLEPEILIVDEVLAVGDAQFQKKCLGKMGEVAKEGRTVVLVSHNMTAILNLCNQAILLDNGMISVAGLTRKVAFSYLETAANDVTQKVWDNPEQAPGNEQVRLHRISVLPQDPVFGESIRVDTPLNVEIVFWNRFPGNILNPCIELYSAEEVCVLASFAVPQGYPTGLFRAVCQIPGGLLNNSGYRMRVLIVKEASTIVLNVDGIAFDVQDVERGVPYHGRWVGLVRPQFHWSTEVVREENACRQLTA